MAHDAFVVGGYTAMEGIPENELADFFRALYQFDKVNGFEMPYVGPEGMAEFPYMHYALSSGARNALTAVPGVMPLLGSNPEFGLASKDRTGRARAVAFVKGMHQRYEVLKARYDGPVVAAIELQSAPRVAAGGDDEGAQWLRDSLGEISEWDWDDAVILLEHCDADTGQGEPAKGFLAFERELDVVKQLQGAPTKVLMSINWGRSYIETKDVAGPVAHVTAAREAGVLGGIMFSGAPTADGAFGPAYSDTHPPLNMDEPTSALTIQAIKDTMAAAGNTYLELLGVKVSVRPSTMSWRERVAQIKRVVDAI